MAAVASSRASAAVGWRATNCSSRIALTADMGRQSCGKKMPARIGDRAGTGATLCALNWGIELAASTITLEAVVLAAYPTAVSAGSIG